MSDQHATADRRGIFFGQHWSFDKDGDAASVSAFSIREISPAQRWSLRGDVANLSALGKVAGFEVEQPLNTIRHGAARSSLRIGPDEWLLIADNADDRTIEAELATGLTGVAHTRVDISHRNIGLSVQGGAVADVINTGCPLDLSDKAFPVGSATRTLFSKAEIVLARLPDDAANPVFRIEVWRSFGRYLATHLTESAELLGAAG